MAQSQELSEFARVLTVNVATNTTILAGPVNVNNYLSIGMTSGATANGSTQATAYIITTPAVEFTTVAAGTGAILPSASPGTRVFIANDGGNNLLLYPPIGSNIDQAATNAAITIVTAGMWEGIAVNTTNWTSISPDSQGSGGLVVTQGSGAITYSINTAFQYAWTNTQTFSNTIVIGNATTNAVLSNTGSINATSLSVGTTVVSNASGVFTTTANVSTNSLFLGTRSITANGYTRLPNGLLMQWGTGGSANVTTAAQTFPVAFSTLYNVTINQYSNSITNIVYVAANTTTTFTPRCGNSGNPGQPYSYIAIGI